jgi:hypothetical protein
VLESLPSLGTGEAWVWNPERDILARDQVRRRRTYDSSATPKVGESRREPTAVSEIDVASLGEKIAATAEKAKADDPRVLRKKIASLKRELAKSGGASEPVVERVEVPIEVPAIADEQIEQLREISVEFRDLSRGLAARADQIEEALRHVRDRPRSTTPRAPRAPRQGHVAARRPARESPESEAAQVSPAQQRILNALAALEAIGLDEAAKVQLALFAQTSPKSSGYANNLGALRSAGLLDYPRGGYVALTEEGRGIADPGEAPDTVEDLHDYVFSLVGPARTRILQPLIEAYPDAIAKDDLAEAASTSSRSSGYANNLGNLRSLGLIDYPSPGYVAALPTLFLEAASR